MTVQLLTEHHLEFQSLKGGCTGLSELHLSKSHIVGNHMSRLKCPFWFCNHHDGKERAGCFTQIVFLVSFDYYLRNEFNFLNIHRIMNVGEARGRPEVFMIP